MERPRVNDVPQPVILATHDSYARRLAELGYNLFEEVQKFSASVEQYTQQALATIWEETIKKYPDASLIHASDELGKYVHWRHSELLREVFVDPVRNYRTGRPFFDTPHKRERYNQDYPYGNDQLTILIEKVIGGFSITAEDNNDLGVIFDIHGNPLAYGGRLFAARAHALNHDWDYCDIHNTGPARQSLLVLIEEAKTLEFKP